MPTPHPSVSLRSGATFVNQLAARTGFIVLALVLASVPTVVAWFRVSPPISLACPSLLHGANVAHGVVLALLGGSGGVVLTVLLRKKPRLRGVALVLVAETFALAIRFVAVDSARYAITYACPFDEESDSARGHVYYLYAVWGVAAVFLLWAAAASWAEKR